ncbi:MAG TPA: ABC transporter substrate-binding protein [Opitutaceae bacterium]|jgi:NitT/TauT family transport system substrate-binding protein|nr:ABC transporter substrate-binding protein [Opitutaceae bacterium]
MKLSRWIPCLLLPVAVLGSVASADPLKIGYSDWPGYTVFEVAVQKGWFKAAGVDAQMIWFDYGPSIDAFSAGKIDADCVVASDIMGAGAAGAKSKFIALIDYSDGSDMIVGKPGVSSIKDLKGQKVGVELTLVEHMLLMEGLERNGMTANDVTLVGTSTNNTPQTLASGSVAAIGAWYPISYQALTQVPGSKKVFTSAEAKGLIYDVLAVSPTSLAARHDDWAKVAAVYYKCVAYLMDPATRDDAIKIMAAKVGQDPAVYAKYVPGTHFETLAEAKANYAGDAGAAMNIKDSLAKSDKVLLEIGAYKNSQKPEDYISAGIVNAMP